MSRLVKTAATGGSPTTAAATGTAPGARAPPHARGWPSARPTCCRSDTSTSYWMIANCKNGVSSYEIHRGIGVTQKTAWFMLHRIRLAMETGSFLKGPGDAEADETFIGGLAKNMSPRRRERTIKGTGGAGKEIVMGVLRRGANGEASKVKAKHVPIND